MTPAPSERAYPSASAENDLHQSVGDNTMLPCVLPKNLEYTVWMKELH
jgi:hypothetical protein